MSDHEEQWWLFEPVEIDDDPNDVIFSSDDDDSFWDTSDSESESDDDSFDDDSSVNASSDDDCSDDDCSDDDCSDDDCSDESETSSSDEEDGCPYRDNSCTKDKSKDKKKNKKKKKKKDKKKKKKNKKGKKNKKKNKKKDKKKDKSKSKSKSKTKNKDEKNIDFNPDKALKAGYKKCLQAHNEKRNLHEDTPPMKLDKILCSQAQEGAEDLGKRNAFAHDTPRYGAGENLFMTSAGRNEDGLSKERCVSFGQSSVNAWYNEINNYSFSKHGKKDDGVIGHFTQLVWKKSVKLGVGIAKRKDGKTIVLCRYSPAGNMNMSKNLPEQIGDLKCKNC